MPRQRKILLVVADGEHCRFVRPGPDNALRSTTALDSLAAHKRAAELGSDHPGAAYHTGAAAHHALAPRHDPHDLEKQKFARVVAEQLNAAAASGDYDELVIAAPPHTLAAIREHLDTTTGAKIVGTLQKDLTKTPDDELWPHVRAWLRPVHRAAS